MEMSNNQLVVLLLSILKLVQKSEVKEEIIKDLEDLINAVASK